jgi:hypothetical protein
MMRTWIVPVYTRTIHEDGTVTTAQVDVDVQAEHAPGAFNHVRQHDETPNMISIGSPRLLDTPLKDFERELISSSGMLSDTCERCGWPKDGCIHASKAPREPFKVGPRIEVGTVSVAGYHTWYRVIGDSVYGFSFMPAIGECVPAQVKVYYWGHAVDGQPIFDWPDNVKMHSVTLGKN